ncbi:hypothetical protein QYE76_002271 [Lolium multiflorum]|uniref:Transposase (putative) gypsy type domain-containing protein n=1 Tax=Lolium multiflorum TaxID=4521 RepID=A0AAD8RQA5_LOLMU|nr:hypothetical protein QYE76_002271 [Lolium multiflorum]
MPRGSASRRPLAISSSSHSCSHRYPLRARARCCSGEHLPLANSGGRISTDPPPPLRQSGATGPRVSTERPQPPLSPPRSQGSSSPFSLSWSSSSSTSSMASPSGSWRGSYMREDDIERLVRLRRIPQSVITRVPGEETEPEPRNGERVVFGAHLDRGLGLPASPFFRQFLDHFGLQPHHLPANACVLLSCFVAPTTAACGRGASIYTRPGTPFPKIPTVDSVKNWQMSFFYVRNEGELVDRINLPEFNPAPPVGRINWSHNARSTDQNAEVNLLWDLLATATAGGLTAEDLLCTIAERRVLPLQMRTHKIGHMSGRFDPNRTSKVPLTKAQVASRVNHITKANLAEDWSYGLVPCDRNHPPARVFERQNAEDGDLATKRWTPDLVDPADQAGDHAGDDDLPQAPDLGGQGEHNPPPSPEQQEEEEPATSGTGPIPAVPLRTRPPSTTATSAPKGTKRAGSTAAAESRAKKQRRRQPKKVPEQAGAPIKFAQGGGSRQAPRVVSPLPRQRREQTPQPSSRAPTPPPPATGASSFAVPLASASAARGPIRRRQAQAAEQELTRLRRWRRTISPSSLPQDGGEGEAAFPETQDAALAAVGDSRRQETGEGSSEYFSMEDHLASMAARIEPVTKLGWELRKAAEELAPDRFLDWKESATRAGADMALSFVLSWYNEVDLGQLEFRRAGVEDKLPADFKAARLARASTIADFVDKTLFVADPNPPPSDGEYMDDEEAEDVPEDDPAAGSTDAPPA